MQSYYVEDGDYVKLDNISVGYTFNLKKKSHSTSSSICSRQ